MEKKTHTFSRYQILAIIMIALIQFTVVLDFMIMSPLGDILMKSMSMSTAQFGSVVSAYAISAGLSGILAAGFADKYDRKKTLMFFYGGFVIGTVLCGLAYSFETLLAARIVTGIFGGVIGSISMAIVTDLFSLDQRGRVMGYVQMAFAASQVMGIPLGLYIASVLNWQSTFFMVVILATIAMIFTMIRLKPLTTHLQHKKEGNPVKHLMKTIRNKNYLMGFLATGLLSLGGFMLMPFTSPFLVNNVGISQAQLPLVFMFTGIASIVIMPVIGKLSDKYDKLTLFTIGTFLAMLMIVIYTNMGVLPIWEVILINVILFMGIMSRMVPSRALDSAIPELQDRGAYMSISSSLQQFAGGIAALFAGMVVVQETKESPIQNFNLLGYIMCGILLLCLYFVYRVNLLVKRRSLSRE